MPNANLYYLLKIVKQKQNLNSLLRAGFSYKQIGEFTEFAGDKGFLKISDDGIILTAAGEEKLLELKKITKKVNKDEWIEQEKKSKIEQIPVDFIFLPYPDELFF